MTRFKRWAPLLLAALIAGCNLAPDPASLDFGEVYVGESAGPQSARWVNNADKNAQLVAVSTRLPYEITNAGVFANAQDIAPGGASQTVQVRFAPTTAGTFNEEVRPVVMGGVRGQYVQLTGRGVWAKNQGAFALENKPPNIVGSFDFSSYPIQPNQPIDWGTRQVGAPAVEAIFQVRNTGPGVNGTAQTRLIHGDRHFTITFPQAHTDMNIGLIGGTGGTREIRVQFDPSVVGEWTDVVEVTDSANPANVAGIVLKARVVPGE